MPRKKNKFPTPSLRMKSCSWCIRWCWERKAHEFSTGFSQAQKEDAETALASFALALRTGDWPEWTDDIAVIQRWKATKEQVVHHTAPATAIKEWLVHYAASTSPKQVSKRREHLLVLADRFNLLSLSSIQAADFFSNLSDNPSPQYLAGKIALLIGKKHLSKAEIIALVKTQGINATEKQVDISLRNKEVFVRIPPPPKNKDIAANKPNKRKGGTYSVVNSSKNGLAANTRNDYLQSFNMFYKWAAKQSLIKTNPFDGIKPARLDAHAEIIWLTRDERDAITRASESVAGRLPIWIALYAGLRLGEIARLRWEDVDLRQRWIHVKKSKTGKTRRVPISEALLSALHRGKKSTGFVCPHWQKGDYHTKADSDLLTVRKSLPELSDKLRWNIFRHTFASLLAQTGKVSIDQISALMGNTPEVCRRHYAHLVPDAAERTGIDLID